MSINLAKISDFVGELSERELIELLESFEKTLIARRGELQVARGEHDYRRIVRLTHNLKSNALYFGAEELHETCQAGERLFSSSGFTEIQLSDWFDEFEAACDDVLQCIEQVLKDKHHDQETRER